jgi:phosphoribosylamine--glycine ligase
MRVLIVGGGGREHALAWKLHQSPLLTGLWLAPGNPGMAKLGTLIPISTSDIDALESFAVAQRFDLTVIGPELPLAEGLVDRLQAHGLLVFGPTRAAAELESSKAFAKQLLADLGIPTASFRVFESTASALEALPELPLPLVVKADGLAAGKGVVVARTFGEARDAVERLLPPELDGQGGKLVLEAFLPGDELSFLCITDGQSVMPLPGAQDHKTLLEGDRGPNTGGMGVVAPTPLLTPALQDEILKTIVEPTLAGMRALGRPFVGVLFAGLMISSGRPYVLEFNARFGDPETEAILPLLASDLLPILVAAAEGRLNETALSLRTGASTTVIMAAGGYPDGYRKGQVIHGVEEANALEDVTVFQAGTALRDGQLVTHGGRVLAVTAVGDTLEAARSRAYEAVSRITWEGEFHRRDIGLKALRLADPG